MLTFVIHCFCIYTKCVILHRHLKCDQFNKYGVVYLNRGMVLFIISIHFFVIYIAIKRAFMSGWVLRLLRFDHLSLRLYFWLIAEADNGNSFYRNQIRICQFGASPAMDEWQVEWQKTTLATYFSLMWRVLRHSLPSSSHLVKNYCTRFCRILFCKPIPKGKLINYNKEWVSS